MHRYFHNKTNLADLPVELVLEVALYLDLKDIVSLQQTNTKLRNFINAPAVWLALSKTYSARHFHIYRPQSGRFGDLTEDELQKWIRKRLHFDRIWEAQTLQPRLRTLSEPSGGSPTLKLVPGGRWLLAGYQDGYVWYCDLDDSKNLEWKILVEPSEGIEGSRQYIYRLAIYADLNMPGLDFTLAIRTKSFGATLVEYLHIWHVKLKNGNSLVANLLAPITTSRNEGLSFALAVGQNVVGRVRDALHVGRTAVEIYWWKRCSKSRFLRSLFLAQLGINNLHLIGDDRVLCMNANEVNLYGIPEPELIDLARNLDPRHDGDTPSPGPTWSYSFSPSRVLSSSPLYYDGTAYRFTAWTDKCIWGFTIPAINGNDPSVIQLSTYSTHESTACVPGLYKGFTLHGHRVGYRDCWESNGDGSATTAYPTDDLKGTPLPPFCTGSAFDEESGRFLCHTTGEITILDFLGK